MQLNFVHDWLNFMTNKKLGTYFSPEENDAALERGQMDEFDAQKKNYAIDEDIQDSLSVFKSSPPFTFTTSNTTAGVITMPDNYLYLLGIQANVVDSGFTRARAVEVLTEDELPLRLDSQLRPVSTLNPVALKSGDMTIQLYPEVPQAGYVYYLFKPPRPNFVYTQVGRVIVYDNAASTQLLWNDSSIQSVMIRALQYLGVSVEDSDMVQFAQSQIQTNP